jgi:hypothetical protein
LLKKIETSHHVAGTLAVGQLRKISHCRQWMSWKDAIICLPHGVATICAGTVGLPHLLLLSGIGPADDLKKLGINVKADLAGWA